MKLIFLGDSFTNSAGIDIEYAIQKKYIENNHLVYRDPLINKKLLRSINHQKLNEIQNFKKENSWVNLISKKLGLEYENISKPGSGLQQIYIEFLNYEFSNSNENNVFLFFLPLTDPTRMLISNNLFNEHEESDKSNNINHFFNTYLYAQKKEDINLFRKKFDVYYFYIINISILMNLIYYLKNNNKNFLILPTWRINIYDHFLNQSYTSNFFKKIDIINIFSNINKQKSEQEKRNEVFKNFFEDFVFSEIKDQMDFNFDQMLLKKLPCGHPNIESQIKICEMYFYYIKKYLNKINS